MHFEPTLPSAEIRTQDHVVSFIHIVAPDVAISTTATVVPDLMFGIQVAGNDVLTLPPSELDDVPRRAADKPSPPLA